MKNSVSEKNIKFIGLVSAGSIKTLQKSCFDSIKVNESDLPNQKKDFWLAEVYGESMSENNIHNGDFILTELTSDLNTSDFVVFETKNKKNFIRQLSSLTKNSFKTNINGNHSYVKRESINRTYKYIKTINVDISLNLNNRRYIGNKQKLSDWIFSIIDKECKGNSFFDVFAGSGSMSEIACKKYDKVIMNDFLLSNYIIYLGFFDPSVFNKKKIDNAINHYNKLDVAKLNQNYFSKNFGSKYFSLEDSKKIGHIREDIEKNKEKLTKKEYAILISSLLYSVDKIANTVGHYDAFLKNKSIKNKFVLRPIKQISLKKNILIEKKDANLLAKSAQADITYIDPPYNSRQYSRAYHLLETLTKWNGKQLFGVASKPKAENISKYCSSSAIDVFKDLISSLNTKYIVISYNDTQNEKCSRSRSIIKHTEILSILEKRGTVSFYEKEFNKFNTGKSKNKKLKERLYVCKINKENRVKFIKSPINYTGGKYKMLEQLTSHFPKNINTFFDIFGGGADVSINTDSCKTIYIDNNKHVCSLFKYIQKSSFEKINKKISQIIRKYKLSNSEIFGYSYYMSSSSAGLNNYNKEKFLKLREDFNHLNSKDKPIYFLILILFSFNNQIRFNLKNEFNIPVGKRDYNRQTKNNLRKLCNSNNFQKIIFKNSDFSCLLDFKYKKNDFIYLDPPYLLGTATYNESGNWQEKEEERLYCILSKINKKNIKFALSNVLAHKGKINKFLKEFIKKNNLNIHDIKYNYKNSNYQIKSKNQKTREVLITNYKL